VLGFELGDPVGSDPGHQVPSDVGAVANQRLVSHGVCCDVVEPVGEPLLDGPHPAPVQCAGVW
jgi:hypothetical protein